ncbi:IS1/IS1595 family N-terminal zinc-binding domain-containing protein [Nostoc sp.]|uniref:IS1/IS1595 family N-terminal zinc-binding domain-containing protein n=1 Tax=Nostoc sp. TaxID=1180 RepID=UPI003FA5C7EF
MHLTHIRKNGHRRDKQIYICVLCERQFTKSHSKRSYSDKIKKQCLTMYFINRYHCCCLH